MTRTPGATNDREARRSALSNFDRPVVLEAGAGTGKTTALVGRLLAWTLGTGWEAVSVERPGADDESIAGALLDGVVAITFSEAAAGEMAKRAQREIAHLAGGGEPPAWLDRDALPADAPIRARRARALLAAIDRLRVQTLHAFAFALLRAHGLELGLHPALAVDADEAGLSALVLDVLGERLPPLYRGGDPALAALARAGVGRERLRAALLGLPRRGLAAAALAADPWSGRAIGAALDAGAEPARALRDALSGVTFSARATSSRAMIERLPALVAALEGAARTRTGVGELARTLADLWPAGVRRRIDDWATGKYNREEATQIADPAAHSAAARRLRTQLALLEAIDPDFLDAARATLAPLAAEIERRMRSRGLATFADLLRLAVDLVAVPHVARDVRRGIRQLLVDELQDTDELQIDLVSRIALEGPATERPGLFLVGDPKQSIYGWRRARLANYFAFVASALGGSPPGQLTANFRSAAGLLEEVERAVAPVMSVSSDVEAPFVRLEATAERVGAPGEIEFWVAWDAGSGEPLSSGESARREAAAIADDLAARISRGALAPRDAAILLRTSAQAERFLDALRERGVPYAVEKDRSYYRRRETIDAAALVRAVLDPADRPALVAWLRSPWVGVPDAALWPLFRAGFPDRTAELAASAPEALEPVDAAIERAAATTVGEGPGFAELAGWPGALRHAVRALAERRAAFALESPERWVDGLRRAFLPDLVAAARFQGRYRLANLDRFFRELAEQLAADEPISRLLADLRSAARERPDESEGRPLEGPGDAVRVLTLHGAKGLEFEEVYLASVHHAPRGATETPAVEAERVGEHWEYRLFGVPTPGLAPAADLADRIRAAEQVRLLYVGLTRSRRRLVVSGALPAGPRAADPARARSLSALLGPRVSPRGSAPDGAAPESWTDPHGARWRLLPPRTGVVEGEAARADPSPIADPGHLPLAEVVGAREAAAARSRRVGVARVTDLAELAAERPETSDEESPSVAPTGPPGAAEVARARGAAVHRALELAVRRVESPASWRGAARAAFARELPDATEDDAVALEAELSRLEASSLLARLDELAPGVLARELPVVLAADPALEAGPLHAVTGTIDLVYLDSGAVVVADFKTDSAPNSAGAERARARHVAQLRQYGRAVRDAFALPEPPRLELWWLAADRIEIVG